VCEKLKLCVHESMRERGRVAGNVLPHPHFALSVGGKVMASEKRRANAAFCGAQLSAWRVQALVFVKVGAMRARYRFPTSPLRSLTFPPFFELLSSIIAFVIAT
jgi:hypothetical protein